MCTDLVLVLACAVARGQLPAPRALHTLTHLGTRCLLVGGSSSGGLLGDVALLQSPPLEAGVRLQQELLLTKEQLLVAQKQLASWQAEVVANREKAQQSMNQRRVSLGVHQT